VRAVQQDALAEALTRHRVTFTPTGAGLQTDADSLLVGQIAASQQVTLIELRAADGAGLEEMFLQLTSDTQRDSQRDPRPDTRRDTEGAVA
jgi:ABC-2 type transport system ATP-binding protein